ncbi:HAD superfamily protein involved in N-acetyl-glucosamine catabolism [hydrothermal vent metagenome]|uniref:HAD superfamily protein involved in N-acetyl-glucosamine catabolism n=1 Tax=hydrothermal vent metagenome TaxID=652676 RepID=A0A3B0T363_9ZZZZ
MPPHDPACRPVAKTPVQTGPAPDTLAGLAARYDVFFIDQYGVLHDGVTPYSGAIDALKALRAAGKRIVLLSNSGKRSAPNEKRLAGLGFDPEGYDVFLSSGEVAWAMLADTMIGKTIDAGAKCLLFTRDDDRSAIEGLDLVETQSGAQAQVILIAGSRGGEWSLDDYAQCLAGPAGRDVPCLCTNPDKVMLTRTGLQFGPGAIADLYVRLGGRVTWIGKPYAKIYHAALARAGSPDRARVVCIGDSVEHDIAGGANAGLATALVRTGIHAGADQSDLSGLFERYGAVPDTLIPGLIWAPDA